MSKEDIKHEINKVLDEFSDKVLQDLLSFLKGIKSKQPVSLLNGGNFERMSEDKDLLEKFAR